VYYPGNPGKKHDSLDKSPLLMFKVKSVIIFDGELPLNPYFGVQFQLQVDICIYIYI
jgi:hypothetical protein